MAKCDLAIEFDQPERQFRPGDTIRGRVTVQVNAQCRCDGLSVSRLWHTHGRGNTDSGGEETTVVFQGEWSAGEVHSYPFSFVAPAWPVTYHGELVNVDHYVRARADIPWAIDPKAEEDFLLIPTEASTALPSELQTGAAAAPHVHAMGAACGVLFGLIFVGAGAIPMTVGLVGTASGEFSAVFAIPFGAVFMFVGLLVAFLSARKVLAERKLGQVEVQVTPREVPAGGSVEIALAFAPRSRVELNQITATLKGQEVAISGSGTNRTTHRHTLYEDAQQLLGSVDVFPGEGTSARGTFQLPADAAPSFHASDNRVEWSLELHVDIVRWPDWTSREVILVPPPVASA